MSKVRNIGTPEGAAIGERLAKWCDDAEPKARLRMPELPPRCYSCAFRQGQHVANTSPQTQMDALKSIMEGHQFDCHDHQRPEQVCSGWAIFMLAKDDADFVKVPWDFTGGVDK